MSDTNNPNAAEKAAKIRRKPERESVLAPTFAAARQPAPDRQQTQPSGNDLLQRQCSCGKHTIGGGMCEECQQKQDAASSNVLDDLSIATPPDIQTTRDSTARFDLSNVPAQTRTTANGQPIQPALTVNAPGDQYEQEADRVAETVMRMPAPAPASSSTEIDSFIHPTVSRLPAMSPAQTSGGDSAFQAPAKVETRINQMQSGGQTLPAEEQDFFKERMGYDFSSVRVHTDANAVQASRDIQAKAFTVGNNIAFNEGAYQPGTDTGRRLLAHELTHVVQQGAVDVYRKPQSGRSIKNNKKGQVLSHFQILQRQQQLASSLEAMDIQKRPELPYIQRDPVLNVTTGTTEDLQRELQRLRRERQQTQSSSERERYDNLIRRLETRIANRGNSTLADCNITLLFDGQHLTVSGARNATFPAVSGQPDNTGSFDYSRTRQRMENIGPIPEGTYWLDPSQLKNLWYYFGRAAQAWGSHRITIHPFDSTHTFGRGGFFIHGGTVAGSAGCIDLTSHMSDFVTTILEQYESENCKVILHVRYPNEEDVTEATSEPSQVSRMMDLAASEQQRTQHLKPVVSTLKVQRIIELPEINIQGNPNFYSRAERRNRYWASNPPQPDWPYTEQLRQLWNDAAYDEFAEAVREYQIDVMGDALNDADGILGPITARSLTSHVEEGSGDTTPAEGEAATTETEGTEEGETTESASSSHFAAVPRRIRERATDAPWRYHEEIYNRFQREGRNLGISGLAQTWEGYLNQMGEMNFLGQRVVGHQAFLNKLEQAQAYLRREHPDLSNEALLPPGRAPLGRPGSRTQWRADESTTSYHTFGMALDIGAATNPWIASSGGQRREWTIWRAVWLIGGGAQPVWSARSHEWSEEEGITTDQLHARYAQSSRAVAEYFTLLENEDQLDERLAALGEPPAQPPHNYPRRNPSIETLRSGDEEQWRQVIRADRENWPAAARETGFMNLRVELVRALRDAGNLSWGACDLGRGDSGDFMHFDMRTPQFERLRNAIRTPMQADLAPFESRLTEQLPPLIEQEIEALNITGSRGQRRFRAVMDSFFHQTLSRYFGRWTDEQKESMIAELQERWNSSRQRRQFESQD